MESKIYVAFYKGRKNIKSPVDLIARFSDWLTRKVTFGDYSHCEIAIDVGNGYYDCYSSSIRDKGVRKKRMKLPSDKWDLVSVPHTKETAHYKAHIENLFNSTKGCKYDWLGALGVKLHFLKQNQRKWFCSEWCAAALGLPTPHRLSPNSLRRLMERYYGN